MPFCVASNRRNNSDPTGLLRLVAEQIPVAVGLAAVSPVGQTDGQSALLGGHDLPGTREKRDGLIGGAGADQFEVGELERIDRRIIRFIKVDPDHGAVLFHGVGHGNTSVSAETLTLGTFRGYELFGPGVDAERSVGVVLDTRRDENHIEGAISAVQPGCLVIDRIGSVVIEPASRQFRAAVFRRRIFQIVGSRSGQCELARIFILVVEHDPISGSCRDRLYDAGVDIEVHRSVFLVRCQRLLLRAGGKQRSGEQAARDP